MGSKRIVVGVDGSSASKAALEWALDEARRRQAELDVVMAWDPVPMYGPGFGTGVVTEGTYEALEASTQRCVDRLVDESAARGDDLTIHRLVRCGRPTLALLDESKGADLLVVGARGVGGVVGLVLGSVASEVVKRSPVPVVVVPAARGRSDAAA
jgi:nucleotide-binding universal stress UspA family protein